ncbi:HNH endonuclease [Rosettibacter firmus]|uniref:HNH endonuclease n=1 Tax=Rosettibacter firmus TaxID=3111522 RepID=UPI00336BBB1B
MTWKEFVYQQIIEYCNRIGSRTFSLRDFYTDKKDQFREFRPNNFHILEKVRQQLQFLRNDGLISFLDNSGHYTLRGIELLEVEKQEIKSIDISKETPEKKEYIIETYVRNVNWAKKAKEVLGDLCLFKNCNNTFIRDDGTRYIEVHHIIPLCKGGEDGLWNLSVLCAHHHKMAHFADIKTRISIEKFLLKEVKLRL